MVVFFFLADFFVVFFFAVVFFLADFFFADFFFAAFFFFLAGPFAARSANKSNACSNVTSAGSLALGMEALVSPSVT